MFVDETATELINGGVAPWSMNTVADFQTVIMLLQLKKEKIFELAASRMPGEKILIVCDRGAMDNKAYMEELDFRRVLQENGLSEVEVRDNYDAVFHLVTAADGAREYYTTENNAARTETPERAAEIDGRLISAWTGHPHFRVIDNSTGFEEKMERLLAEIAFFLGEPEPFEIERKFLIEYPDLKRLEANPHCRRVDIVQTYLQAADGDEVRIRKRGCGGEYLYYKTTKRRISGVKRVETERRLSQSEYLDLLTEADSSRRQICKTRYCLTYRGRYFEIDVYPFWQDRAIAEIELSREDEEIVFPEEIKVIREVTDDEAYKNAHLAERGVCEKTHE